MSPFTVCAFGIVAACIIAVIKPLRPELSTLAAVVAGVLIFIYIINGLTPFVEFIKGAAADTGAEGYFTLMIKSLAVSLCCRMSADICRDCGESSLASRVELAGKAGIVIISLPIVTQLLNIAKDMLG